MRQPISRHVLIAALAGLACASSAAAQTSRGGLPSVEVNTQLIESLGPGTGVAPTIPALPGIRVGPGYPGGAGYAYAPAPDSRLPPPRSQLHVPLPGAPTVGAVANRPQRRSAPQATPRSSTVLPMPATAPRTAAAPTARAPSRTAAAPIPGASPPPLSPPPQPGPVLRGDKSPPSPAGSLEAAAARPAAPPRDMPKMEAVPQRPVAVAPAPAQVQPAEEKSPAASGTGVMAGGAFGRVVSAPPPAAPMPAAPLPGATIAAPAPAPMATAPATSERVAALPPGGGASLPMSLSFEGVSPNLARAGETQLEALAQRLSANQQERIQINAYADGESPAAAKRLALSRALAVRAYLTERGVAATRIDVRAVGLPESGPKNRVDLLTAAR